MNDSQHQLRAIIEAAFPGVVARQIAAQQEDRRWRSLCQELREYLSLEQLAALVDDVRLQNAAGSKG